MHAVGAGGQGCAYRYQLPQQLDHLSDRFKQRLEQLCKESRPAVQQEVLTYIANIVAKEYRNPPSTVPLPEGTKPSEATKQPYVINEVASAAKKELQEAHDHVWSRALDQPVLGSRCKCQACPCPPPKQRLH
jgi:hypothetical protein